MSDVFQQSHSPTARFNLELPPRALRYALAVGVVLIAWLLRWLLTPSLGLQLPFITFFIAVFLSAWYGGLGPALLAAVLSALLARYFFLYPVHTFGLADPIAIAGLLLFVLTGAAAGWLAEGRIRAVRQADQAAAVAEEQRARAEEQAVVAEEEAARAEEERLQAEEARAESEAARAEAIAAQRTSEWQAGLLEQTHDAVLVWELGGPVVFWNRAAELVYGWTRDEVLGKRSHEVLRTSLADATSIQAVEEQVALTGTWEGELQHQTRDGRKLTVQSRLVLLAAGAGRRLVLETNRDMTERRRTEDQLRQAQKMEAVGQLAGGLAHDFNNLLGVIVGYMSLLGESFERDDPRREQAGEVQEAAERAAQLTQQLVAFSRQQVLRPTLLDLNLVLTEFMRMGGRLLGEDIEVALVKQPDLWAVSADRGQIEQVLMNLVVNARDAMPEGGKLTLETRNVELDPGYSATHLPATPGPHVVVSVSDTGIGMDAATQQHIFEPFFTTKDPGRGTGLGLAMVYGVIKQSGGNIWMYSEPGHGTTFKLYFPRARQGAAPESAPSPELDHRGGTETVLVVEDNDSLRRLTVGVLKANGYTVLEAANGGEALLIAEQHEGPIHLLLTDVVLPRLSGRKLAERLRAQRPETQVLYMSGYTDDAVVLHGALEPGLSFLQKPFRPDALTRRVREVLDGAPQQGARF